MTARFDGMLYHGAAVLLVGTYVQAFPVWSWLAAGLGRPLAALVPFGAAAVILVLTGVAAGRLAGRRRPAWLPLLAGAGLTLAVLALPDAQFPAKRIHVAEYLVLAVLVCRALSPLVTGPALTLLGALAAALYGMHDELIQGLTPPRTFGLTDILVDALSGLAGALMLQGLRLFEREGLPTTFQPSAGLALILLGSVLFILPLPAYDGQVLPVWPVLPLLAGGFVWFFNPPPAPAGLRRACDQISLLALLLAVYPVVSQLSGRAFH